MSGSKIAGKLKKATKAMRPKATKPLRRAASVVELHAMPGRLMLVSLRGKLGHPARALAQFDDVKVVGALENAADMRDIVLQTGAAVLATLLNYPLNQEGKTVSGMMAALAELAGLDVDAIRAAARKEAEEEARAELEQSAALSSAAAIAENPDHLEDELAFAQAEAGPTGES